MHLCKKIFKAGAVLLGVIVLSVTVIYLYNTVFVESKDPRASAPASTKFITAGSEDLAYREWDNKATTTVVFVGGLSAWSGTWERVIDAVDQVKGDVNYIAIDLPPFGYSIPVSNARYFRDVQAERIETFVKAKNIEHVVIVGHSYGAGPATEYALRNPDTVKRLVVVDGVLNIDEQKIVNSKGLIQADLIRTILLGTLVHNDSFAIARFKGFVTVTDAVNQDLLDVYTRYFETKRTTQRLSAWLKDYVNDPLVYKSNTSENYKTFLPPVRLIWGKKDTITPVSGAEKMLSILPNVKLDTLEGVGHIPMIENRELFNEALLEALTN